MKDENFDLIQSHAYFNVADRLNDPVGGGCAGVSVKTQAVMCPPGEGPCHRLAVQQKSHFFFFQYSGSDYFIFFLQSVCFKMLESV